MKSIPGKVITKQNLSSDTLFRFTSELDVLIDILDRGIQARYIYEKLPRFKLAYFTRAACFCDIPLGSIKYHLNYYGEYGIGIEHSWAKKQKITPVIYVHSNTPHLTRGSSESDRNYLKSLSVTPFLKQVKGKQPFDDERGIKVWRWKKYYEEREWRFIPDRNVIDVVKYKKENELIERKAALNGNGHINLQLLPTVIEYIIVKDRNEIQKLVQYIRKSYENIRQQDELITKIITTRQIRRDF
jgi:hypothetical protein